MSKSILGVAGKATAFLIISAGAVGCGASQTSNHPITSDATAAVAARPSGHVPATLPASDHVPPGPLASPAVPDPVAGPVLPAPTPGPAIPAAPVTPAPIAGPVTPDPVPTTPVAPAPIVGPVTPAPAPSASAPRPVAVVATACDGMDQLTPAQVESAGGVLVQNLTHAGMSLSGVPNAYQGHRLRFGSCSMAAALTQFNGFVVSRNIKPSDASTAPFYQLGTVTPRRHVLFQLVGEADVAVDNNFNECHAGFAASAEGMADCLSEKLGRTGCLDGDLKQVTCPEPKVSTLGGTIEQRRAFIRQYFSQADARKIMPLTCPWDTRVILGPPQANESDVKFEHVSAIIGRRVSGPGKCELLIRNSWGTCSNWGQQYPFGSCDSLGRTDDVWVDSDAFLKRSGELTYLEDAHR